MDVWWNQWYVYIQHSKFDYMALSLILHQAIPWFSAAVLGPFLVDPVCHSRIFGRYDIHRES